MLSNLVIQNIAVIERAEIDFNFGLNVFTGETGAGKSIIIDSIHAVLGERTSRNIIRTGADSAFVSALFTDISDEIKDSLSGFGIECEDNTLLIQRKLSSDGKNVCRINGNLATLSMIREISPYLINIHGQHDEHELLDCASHCGFIDSFGKHYDCKNQYLDSFTKLKKMRKQIKSLQMDKAEKERKIELLKYQVNELQDADIRVGEYDELYAKSKAYANSEKILKKLNEAYSAVNSDNGASTLLEKAASCVTGASASMPSLEKLGNELNDLFYRLQSCSDEIRGVLDTLDFSEDEMDRVNYRLALISRLGAKYGPSEREMLDYCEKASRELQDIELSDENLRLLNVQYEELRSKTEEYAHKLSEERHTAGKRLCERIQSELEFLDMPNVKFTINNNIGNFTSNGIDNIEFLVATNLGESPKPLSKIASGGELSRIMLAIKNVLAEHDFVGTLIFDEVDTGISGRAAQKVGIKLHELSKHRQVICVTHLSQLASEADTHFLIEKSVTDERTFTTVKKLDFEGRKREIARIMGGMNITKLMLKNAEEILLKNKNRN